MMDYRPSSSSSSSSGHNPAPSHKPAQRKKKPSPQEATLRKRVNIEVAYTHSVNYEEPTIDEHHLRGSLFQLDDDTYILAYDTELNGTRQTHTLKVHEGLLSWVIIGDTHSRQNFKAGEWYSNQYFMDGSTLMFRNKARRLDYCFNEEGGFIDLFYELYSGDTHLGYYSLEVYIH